MSKFHAWNFRFGATARLWNIMRKILEFRRSLEGGDATLDTEERTDEKIDKNSPAALLQKIKALQRGKHTLDLACAVFSDMRVRKLGYMTLPMQVRV